MEWMSKTGNVRLCTQYGVEESVKTLSEPCGRGVVCCCASTGIAKKGQQDIEERRLKLAASVGCYS